MDTFWIYALGFLGQAFFGARLIVQLIFSEKQGRVVSPTQFWLLSLAGALIFYVYGLFRSDLIIIIGQLISYFIYIRNLQLKNYWPRLSKIVRWVICILPFLAIGIFISFTPNAKVNFSSLGDLTHPIMVVGAIGQLALNLRFVYQWWYSEQHETSILPIGFWHISTWASVLVLIYATFHPIHQIDPVLLVAQGFGIIVYIRNLIIARKTGGVASEL